MIRSILLTYRFLLIEKKGLASQILARTGKVKNHFGRNEQDYFLFGNVGPYPKNCYIDHITDTIYTYLYGIDLHSSIVLSTNCFFIIRRDG